jgi:hypothetical protein
MHIIDIDIKSIGAIIISKFFSFAVFFFSFILEFSSRHNNSNSFKNIFLLSLSNID